MTGIIPTPASGGLPVRDANGNPIAQPSVQNAYIPPASFTVSCDLLYLPSDCTARITAAQINAFQAEIMCLTASLDPDGTWNCTNTCNLSQAFQNWVADTLPDLVSDAICEPAEAVAPDWSQTSFVMCGTNGAFRGRFEDVFTPDNIASAVCSADAATVITLTTRIVACDGAGNLLTMQVGSPEWLSVLGQALCDAPEEGVTPTTSLIACNGSGGIVRLAPSEIIGGPQEIVTAICGDDAAADALSACLVSTDAGNTLETGTDGRLFSSGIAMPLAAPACEIPATLLGYNAGGDLLRFDPSPFISRTYNPEFAGAATGDLGVAGQVVLYDSGDIILTSPHPCRPMRANVDLIINSNVRMVGNGAANFYTMRSIDGGAPTVFTGNSLPTDPNLSYSGRGAAEESIYTSVITHGSHITVLNPGVPRVVRYWAYLNVSTPFTDGGVGIAAHVKWMFTSD